MGWLFLPEAIIMFSTIIPPRPITKMIYLCDRRFHPEVLEKLYGDKVKYGVGIIRGEEAHFYLLEGTKVTHLSRKRTQIAKNQKKGGQSAPRIQRLRVEEIHRYLTDLVEKCRENYLTEDNQPNIHMLYLVGSGDKKEQLRKELPKNLKQITETVTITEKDDIHSIKTITDVLIQGKVDEDSQSQLGEFYQHLERDTGRAVYGRSILGKYLKESRLERLYLAEKIAKERQLDMEQFRSKCQKYSCELVVLSQVDDGFVEGYGGIAGITFY